MNSKLPYDEEFLCRKVSRILLIVITQFSGLGGPLLGFHMNNAQNGNQNLNVRRLIPVIVFGVATILCVYFITNRSNTNSDSFTFLDVTVCIDEGLLSFQVPMVLRSETHRPDTQAISFTRGPKMWNAPGGGGKATLRTWMSMLDRTGCKGAMMGDFGYWTGSWQSQSRPGPFLVAFVPIWFAISTVPGFVAIL